MNLSAQHFGFGAFDQGSRRQAVQLPLAVHHLPVAWRLLLTRDSWHSWTELTPAGVVRISPAAARLGSKYRRVFLETGDRNDPFPHAPSGDRNDPFPHAPEGVDVSKLNESRQRLAEQAKQLARAGYEIGVEVAALLPWSKLERMSDVDELAEWLLEENAVWDVDHENSSPFLLEVWSRMGHHPLADSFDLEHSLTARRGVALGVLDMRDAVLRELGVRTGAGSPRPSSGIPGVSSDTGIRKGDVPEDLLAIVVGLVPDTFRTKDVSEHPEMTAALAPFLGQRQYHAVIGRRLSESRERLGLTELAKGGARGSTWRKRRSAKPAFEPANTDGLEWSNDPSADSETRDGSSQ